jgi:CMP-N,N'-diacetyllegionaminic acid synthase
MKTLALITARGGSKGIPGKNVRPLAGRPLIEWTIAAAQQSELRGHVVVSTDDAEIAAVARRAGADVPFMRPSALATDASPGVDAVLHALEQLPAYDSVLLLQPTSPLRSRIDIDACLALVRERSVPSVVSVTECATHPAWCYGIGTRGHLTRMLPGEPPARRQGLPPAYVLNGALYYSDAAWLRRGRRLVTEETLAYVMPAERSVDIDTWLDWKFAELLLQEAP